MECFDTAVGAFRPPNYCLYKWKTRKNVAADVTVTENNPEMNAFEIQYEQNVLEKILLTYSNPYYIILFVYVKAK